MNNVFVPYIKGEKDFSVRFNNLIKEIKNDSTITIEKGEYYLDSQINVIGKDNLIFDCQDGVVFLAKFDRTNGGKVPTKSINAFYFENCNNIIFNGSIVKADCPTNVRGKIIKVNHEEDYVDIEVYPESPLPGDVEFIGGMTFDENRIPTSGAMATHKKKDYRYSTYKDERIIVCDELVTTNPPSPTVITDRLSENVFRFHGIMNMHVHKEGLDCTLYHAYYGVSAFVFRNTTNVTIDGVKIHRYGGMGFLVLTRCMNFTFKNVIFDNPDKEHSWTSTQSDAIHTLGLGGYLNLENIYFDATCDDCLNVHSQILTVSEIDENKYKVIYNKKKGIVSKTWAKKGDKLYVYNPENLVIKGEAVVNSFENGYLTLTEDSYNLSVGDMITNCAYMPEVKIVNCTVHKCVGQFKIKSCVKALVKNCKFYSEGRAVNVSTFIPTLEGGPVQNVIIEENEFNYSLKHAPIFVGFIKDFSEYTNDYTRKDVPIIKNVTIRNNVFNKISCNELMRIACCDGALIENNKYVDCAAQKIAIYNSENVTIK